VVGVVDRSVSYEPMNSSDVRRPLFSILRVITNPILLLQDPVLSRRHTCTGSGRGRHRLLLVRSDSLLTLQDHLEELAHLSEADVQGLGATHEVQQRLRIEDVLGNDAVGLAQGAHAHDAGVGAHRTQHAGDGAVAELRDAVEAELATTVAATTTTAGRQQRGGAGSGRRRRRRRLGCGGRRRVQRDELNLRLEVVAEADDARAALRGPRVRHLLELGRVQAPAVELRLDVAVERVAEDELELTVQKRLLTWVERDGEALGGRGAAGRLDVCELGLE
jgi:hypothetical protein